jgi:hypothetical protein
MTRPGLTAALVTVLAIDAVTFLMLPTGAERNAFVLALGPGLAIILRAIAAATLVLLANHVIPQWREPLMLPAIVAGAFGAGSNISILV